MREFEKKIDKIRKNSVEYEKLRENESEFERIPENSKEYVTIRQKFQIVQKKSEINTKNLKEFEIIL